MESQSLKLSLNLSPPWLLEEQSNNPENASDLRDYLARLESELRKIEYFKSELPMSVLLVTDAVERLKEEVGKSEKEQVRVACDLNESPRTGSEISISVDGDKKTWMQSAQLWSSDHASSLQLDKKKTPERAEEKTGALSSFTEGSDLSPVREDVDRKKPVLSSPALPLKVRTEPVQVPKIKGGDRGSSRNTFVPILPDNCKPRYQAPPPASESNRKKKNRRTWSPELHRRFVAALNQLGGSQVATPKQIRDLMQVNGLTNDEVKSHLQKYRLHIRKCPRLRENSSMAEMFSCHDIDLEVSGGGGGGPYWPTGSKEAETSPSGSSQGSLQMAMRPFKCNSTAGSRCHSIELNGEDKSDSHSWGGI
ncbi:hypothetical protein V2J09_021767 [Rumex salicifolius]